MDKNNAVEELKKRGYEAQKIGGIVMIRVDDGEYKSHATLKKLLKEIGYNASWGIYVADDT